MINQFENMAIIELMKKISKLGLVFAFAVLLTANEAHAEQTLPTYGVGGTSCAVMGKNYAKNPKLTKYVFGSWMSGFVTAVDAILFSKNHKVFNDKEGQTMWVHMRFWCNNHPMASFATGVASMAYKMTKTDSHTVPSN